ncbi:MAG: hypothetical protein COV01_01075 [Candidatus Taylorbacteria bacterium CG10_big_fil_rev_8_21_14_0_10_41_48]|uniref:HTH deoR-type domain-containing protein n=1 Tax=Candidatus Taylorbacteria bacterium CG10_big_fil_rev_8_21_14_0_10_41_48 TaxID=1975024 RepID=A0A2M8LDA6_9BACT|nr:MAG: hypothetical protein COV01_01075 [Candidatus Taylorbacteria bacterium CG10_big_fil_rev_8_21_14_0_10_41_48]
MDENKPETNRSMSASNGDSNLAELSVFNRSKHFLFIYKKTERLVTAVYMITNFIKDSEPLKWRMRERALELMGLNMSFNTVSLSERKELLREYQAISIEIVSLTSIAYRSGLISEMNWSILKKEFETLVDIIERGENRQANEETIIISPDFFDTPKTETSTTSTNTSVSNSKPAPTQTPVFYKGHETKTVVSERSLSFTPRRSVAKKEKDIPRITSEKGDRKDVIISILRQKDGLSVKDFVDSFKNVSEKTIQRDLLAMVASGTIRKEGERRWSRYFMKKS